MQKLSYFVLVNNILKFYQVMKSHNCYQLVFSSSCCVYGNPEILPITEENPIGKVTNVYGRTKYLIEEMLMDLSRSDDVITTRVHNKSCLTSGYTQTVCLISEMEYSIPSIF